jgi:hypothetical protein
LRVLAVAYKETERVEKKAYEFYEKRGRQHGRDFDDWLEAEKIVEAAMISGQ